MRSQFQRGSMPASVCAALAALLIPFTLTNADQARAETKSARAGAMPSGVPGITLSAPRPRYPRDILTRIDEMAALEAIQVALSGVADGATYVWRRNHGYLNAVIRPTQSFKDSRERVCRHVVIMLNSGTHSRRAEGIACRISDGRWSLEG